LLLFLLCSEKTLQIRTLLIALGITIIVSVVEGGIPNGGYIREILAITIYGFPMEQALPAAMIVNFSGSDGNIVKCEWRRRAMLITISEGRSGFQTR
jgi:hypothetical protein